MGVSWGVPMSFGAVVEGDNKEDNPESQGAWQSHWGGQQTLPDISVLCPCVCFSDCVWG